MNNIPNEVIKTLLIVLALGVPFCFIVAKSCIGAIKSTNELFIKGELSEKDFKKDKLVLSQFTIISIFLLILIFVITTNIFK